MRLGADQQGVDRPLLVLRSGSWRISPYLGASWDLELVLYVGEHHGTTLGAAKVDVELI